MSMALAEVKPVKPPERAKGSAAVLVKLSTSLRLLKAGVTPAEVAEVNSNAALKPSDGLNVYALKIPAAPVMLPGLIVPAPDNLPTFMASPIVPEPPRKAPLAMLTSV